MWSLVTVRDVPEYLRDNPKITFGYRREMCASNAMRTLFMWHNETANIWSHLIATITFLGLMTRFLLIDSDKPKWPMFIFEAGAIYVFSVSTFYHMLLCVSRSSYVFWRKMDFYAILVVMFSMFWPFCHYALERPMWYIGVAFVITCTCLCATTLAVFQNMHVIRPLVFAMLGAWGTVPVIRAGPEHMTAKMLCVAQLSLHSVGAVIYVLRWPERRTGRFNYFSSHFWFHVLIFVGLVCFHEANLILYLKKN